jgi:DNA polymerase-3 subunit epsilon
MNILFFDFETTGLPVWKEPSGGDNQPHIVEVYAELVDSETRETIEAFHALGKPNGWTIPQDVIDDVHGITNERALAEGIPEVEIAQKMIEMKKCAGLRVGHGVNFDDRIMRIALKRFLDDDSYPKGQQPSDIWKSGEKFCTMWKSRAIWGLPKIAKLGMLYEERYKEPLKGAHSAMVDVHGCKRLYFDLVSSESQAEKK